MEDGLFAGETIEERIARSRKRSEWVDAGEGVCMFYNGSMNGYHEECVGFGLENYHKYRLRGTAVVVCVYCLDDADGHPPPPLSWMRKRPTRLEIEARVREEKKDP